MSAVQQIQVVADEEGQRVDRWFKKHFPGLPFGRLQKLLRSGQVRVDGGRVKTDTRLSEDQIVRVPPLGDIAAAMTNTRPKRSHLLDTSIITQSIIYQDKDLLVLNKPVGLAVQGGSGTIKHVDGLLQSMGEERGEVYRLTHRLDRDTSGVLLIAKSALAAKHYTEMFRTNQVQKIYWAVVAGVPSIQEGQIDAPLIKGGGGQNEKMAVDFKKGKKATTYYRVIDQAGKMAAWLMMAPQTGRTHQLRVHATSMDTPILGDGKYGGKTAYLEGAEIAKKLHLHARRIETKKPDGSALLIEAPLSSVMKDTFRYFGFDESDREAVVMPE